MSEVRKPQSGVLGELMLAPSLQELQNAVASGRLGPEQFTGFWRKAAAQAQLRGNLPLLRQLLNLLAKSSASATTWGRLLAHQYTGHLRLSEGQFDQALQEFAAQGEIAHTLHNATELTLAYLEQAQANLFLYRLGAAAGYLEEATRWAELSHEPTLVIRTLNRRAELAAQQQLAELSQELAGQALQMAEQQRLRLEQASALQRRGLNWLGEREWDKSETALREALRLRQTVRDQLGQAESWLGLSNLYLKQQNYPQALAAVERSLELTEKLENQFGIAQALHQKGQIIFESGLPEAALPWVAKAVEWRLHQGEPTRLALAFSLLGRVQSALGQTLPAVTDHLKVIELYQPEYDNPQWVEVLVEAGDYLLRANTEERLGTNYWQQALESYRAAIALIERNQNLLYLAPLLGRMARALLKLDGVGGLPEAVRCYQLELTLAGDIETSKMRPEEAIALRSEALTGLQVCASLQRRRQE